MGNHSIDKNELSADYAELSYRLRKTILYDRKNYPID